jgi:hypothetical protein
MAEETGGAELVAAIKNAGGILLAVTENRNWIEAISDGSQMHTHTVNRSAHWARW